MAMCLSCMGAKGGGQFTPGPRIHRAHKYIKHFLSLLNMAPDSSFASGTQAQPSPTVLLPLPIGGL